jgi:hypothetical protein
MQSASRRRAGFRLRQTGIVDALGGEKVVAQSRNDRLKR